MSETTQEFTTIIGEPKILDEILTLFSDWKKSKIKFTWDMEEEFITLWDFGSKRTKDNELVLNFLIRNTALSNLWKKLTAKYPIEIKTTVAFSNGFENIFDLTIKGGEFVKQVCIKNTADLDDPYNYECHSTLTGQKFSMSTSKPDESGIQMVNQSSSKLN